MPNKSYSVITNFGCHYQCPYCITKQTGMALPETDALAVSKTLRNLLRDDYIEFLSFSGGGDPMHGIVTDKTRAAWYAVTQEICYWHNVETEMHTSAETLRQYMHDDDVMRLLRGYDRVVYHCRTVDDLDRVNKAFPHHEGVYDGTLRDYLLDGHSEGRWHYTEQGDYNRYIVNDRVFDRFKDIALAYSR